ncbi:DUF4134 family protein [Chryseobacterium oncorhynchi]|uniref:Uncharacterized protein n=1 Tax=Chryseobacterium oncorhynchi TaxID=741074 RepID=A0A316WEX5_9FLAO|nr:DUF4134 family protein [Chryseobacterium oncorhynchi]PWN59972.1 hypothetical protein C1638_020610 [Chryseobacterium oncorhynchi]
MKKKISISFFAVLSSVLTFAQSGSVSSILQNQTSEVKSSVTTISSWVMAIMGLAALVQAILIFTSSQGTGEEKIKKAGTWIFMVAFCALGFVIVKALFPN